MGVALPLFRDAAEEVVTAVHRIRNYLNSPEHEALSISEIERVATYDWSQSGNFQFFFYIIEGEGEFVLNDTTTTLSAGDIFVVPPHSQYRTPAGVRLLAITTPRFQPEQRAH